jgi:cell division protease FtsH
LHARDKKLAKDINLEYIAGDTAGFTGAELENILNESAIIATVKKHDEIKMHDIEDAVKKVMIGLQKQNKVISDKDKKITAYHEAGHAIVSRFLETQFDVKEISIIPRGITGGYTMYKTNEDRDYRSKTDLEEEIVGLLGGRAAEKLVVNDISTGAGNDIERATAIASDMVAVYGMSEKIGPINLISDGQNEKQIFGDKIDELVGQEVKEIIDKSYKKAQDILLDNIDILHAVAQRLIEKETISADEFESFFKE